MGRFMRTQNKGSYSPGGDDRYAQCRERHPDAVDEENHLAWSAWWFGRVFILKTTLTSEGPHGPYPIFWSAEAFPSVFVFLRPRFAQGP